MLLSDCAINVSPSYKRCRSYKMQSLYTGRLGIECPNVACIAPVEVINEKMQETIDAAMLSKASERGQIKKLPYRWPSGHG